MDNEEQLATLHAKCKELIKQNLELGRRIYKLENIIKRLIKEIQCYIDVINSDTSEGDGL